MKLKEFIQATTYSLKPLIFFREKSSNEIIRAFLSILLFPIGLIRYIYIYISLNLKAEYKDGVAVVTIIKNEKEYIKEYIEWYRLLGCKVIIYDNNSNDGSDEFVKSYNDVDYIYWHGKKRQNDAYNDALRRYKDKYKYICFFDVDEFLVADGLFKGESLVEILDKIFINKKIACLGINWLIFGSSGCIENPGKNVVDAFTHCAYDDFEWNQLVKSIVKPEKIIGFVNPHLPINAYSYKSINLDGKEIDNPRNELPKRKDIRLYHYFVKNFNHFKEKVEKGMADRNAKRTMDEFYYYNKNDIYNNKAIKLKEYLIKNNKKDYIK